MGRKRKEMTKTAVALQYNEEKDQAPCIVAAGKGLVAERIISIADEYGVPIHQEPGLAEELARFEIGTEIPPRLYEVIAEVLYFIHRLNDQWKEKILSRR